MKILFEDKLNELYNRLELIKSYKEQSFGNIEKYNEILFGKINPELVKLSKEKFLDNENNMDIL